MAATERVLTSALVCALALWALVSPAYAAAPDLEPESEESESEAESESDEGAAGPWSLGLVGRDEDDAARGPSVHDLAFDAHSELDPERMRLIWEPASVAWPLTPLAAGAKGYAQLAASLEQRQAIIEGRESAPSVRGAVELDAQRGVGVWVAALETVRVRQFGPPVALRFIRGVDGSAAVIEGGRELPAPTGERRFELHQPPSLGAVWSIEADEPTRVMIERVAPRPIRYAAVEVEQALLQWIHDEGGLDEMPTLLLPADDLERRLRLHAELATELRRIGGDEKHFVAGVEAWRMLAAINEIDRQRPATRPYYVLDRKRPLKLAETSAARLNVDDSREYRLAENPRRWTITRKGPGQLRIAARSWAPKGEQLQPAELRIYVDGRFIDRVPLSDRAAKHSADPNTALPVLEPLFTENDEAVGEFADTSIVLAPGKHDYELELVGGPALLAVDGARRIEASLLSLRGWTPRKRAKAVAKAVHKSSSPAIAWLELLLVDQTLESLTMAADDPRVEALAKQSPVLAIEALALLAADERLDDLALQVFIDRVRPWFARLARDPSIDPAVRGQLRTHWLELVAIKGSTSEAGRLVEYVSGGADPISELPVEGLRLLAELFEPRQATVRSPVLAVLELARARAPADEGLREQTLRLWTALSRWSRRRPVSDMALDFGLPFFPIAQWLVPRTTVPVDPIELANTWLRLDIGVPLKVRAELGPGYVRREVAPGVAEGGEGPGAEARAAAEAAAAAPKPETRRRRLVDVHVASPIDDPDPVLVQVDDQRWWSPQLAGVVRHRIALSEGEHELTLDGPAGTVAWAELPPVEEELRDPGQLGRRERMWSLPDANWYLPGPAIPGIVRLELRWPMNVEPRAVRIVMQERGDYAAGEEPAPKQLLFDPRTARVAAMAPADAALAADPVEIDRQATPLAGSPWASVRHDIILSVGAATKSLSFEVEDELALTASLSLRRGLRPGDLYEGMAKPRVTESRDGDRIADAFDGLSALDGEELLAELDGLSRLLFYTPDDFESRARRAALLLMLGETGHARADLVRLAAWSEREGLPARRRDLALALLGALEDRFDALIEPREMVVTDPRIGDEALLIEPALAAVVGPDRVMLEHWLETWKHTRSLSEDEAVIELELALSELELARNSEDEPPDLERLLLLGELSRADYLSRDDFRAREASRAWIQLYGRMPGTPGQRRAPLAVGLAAVAPLLVHLDSPDSDARDAGVAYGLARELEPSYGHTSVRRLAFISALRSGWDTINHSVDNSGFERLELPISELRRSPSARIREALLIPPWSAGQAEELRPGRKGVLAWDADKGRAEVEFWCRVARPDLGPREADLADEPPALGSAKLSVRLRDASPKGDTVIEEIVEVVDGQVARLELPINQRARHRLEVLLSPNPVWLCSWRTRTYAADRPNEEVVVEPRRRARWWTAGSERPVEFVVLGPASLDLEVRGVSHPEPNKQPAQLIASVTPLRKQARAEGASAQFDARVELRSGEVERGALALREASERAVITEARRHFRVNYTNEHSILLTEPIAYRVQLKTDQGRALIRARARRDRGEVPPPAQVSLREIDPREQIYPDEFDWRTGGPANAIVARDEIEPIRNRIGSLDARLSMGLDDLAEFETFIPRFGLFARVGWRREVVDNALWMTIAAQTRIRTLSPVAAGGIFGLGARVAPLGVRLGANLDVLGSSWAGRPAGSVRLYGWIDRPTWLGRFVQLRPGLTAGIRWQSLNPASAASPDRLQPHPRVYNTYIETHPLFVRPELELRGYPFQDMALSTMISIVPNSDLRSFDQFNWDLGVVGIGRRPRPWVPTWGLNYQLSSRFVDAHRDNVLLRHRIGTEVGIAVWARDIARFAVGLQNHLYLNQQPGLGVEAGDDFVRDVFQIFVRLDGVWGRRMRDYGPGELWFGEPWAPRGWGDDPHQAPSTQLRKR